MKAFAEIKLIRPSAGLLSKGIDSGATQKQVMSRLVKTMGIVLGDFKKEHQGKMIPNKGGYSKNRSRDRLGIRSGDLKKAFKDSVKRQGDTVIGTRGAGAHKYAGIHEYGGRITSDNYMWIPLPGVKMTPREFRDKKVFYLKRKKGDGKVAMLITGKKSAEPKFTLVKEVKIPKRDILAQAQRAIMDKATNRFQDAVVAVLEGR